jgi:aminoglycoside phosphotransferase (APT) family kinase protein
VVGIPACLNDVDAEWLTAALRDAGHDAPDITSVFYEPMPGIVGALGEIGIFSVAYARDTDLPDRLVGKCPLDHDAARVYNSIMQYYVRENGFYRDLADDVPMRVPRCWVNLSDGDRHLLLIDFVEGESGDILEGTSFALMKRLVGDLANLHGRYWMDDAVRALPWVKDWRTPSFLTGIQIVRQGWADVTSREPELVPADLHRACTATIEDVERWLVRYDERPWTFIHGDYQLDNIVFRGDDIVVVDWQGCMACFPGMDLGWLLASSASDETVAREAELVDHYRSLLATSGGPEWSRDDVVEDMAWSMIHYVRGLTLPYSQDYSALGEQGRRLEERFRAFLERSIAAAVRWDTAGRIAHLI